MYGCYKHHSRYKSGDKTSDIKYLKKLSMFLSVKTFNLIGEFVDLKLVVCCVKAGISSLNHVQ